MDMSKHPRVLELLSLRQQERNSMKENGAGANTLYGFDLRTTKLTTALIRQLNSEAANAH